ncbi:MAG: hypothetical protein WCK02_16495 [Bacteroidota bacterium]
MTAIENYVEYWDDWHSEWFTKIKSNNPKDIKGWNVPYEKGGNENQICKYFPEPFWGCITNDTKAVFLNINPGGGGIEQDITEIGNVTSQLYDTFTLSKEKYSETIKVLSDKENRYYPTTKWMQEKRVNWLNKILGNSSLIVSDIFCADLIPWHTKTKSDIQNYIQDNKNIKQIIEQVINPLANIAQSIDGVMKGKVIVRSGMLLDILNSESGKEIKSNNVEEFVVIDKVKKSFSKFNSYLTVLEIEGTKFFVFSGGSSMALPNSTYFVLPINNKNDKVLTLKEFLTK